MKLLITCIFFVFATFQFPLFSANSATYDQPQFDSMHTSLVDLQQRRKLDGTILIAKGNEKVIFLDNSSDHLDSVQGIRGQYTIGSVGKHMMAVALLKAMYDQSPGNSVEARVEYVEQQLQRPILDFLPVNDPVWQKGLPEWASQVTVHQLLCHQSGIPDFTRFEGYFQEDSEGKQFEEHPHETWEFLELIKGEPLDFVPGTSEAYSNTGYTLVKEIIRSITEKSPQEYMNQALFSPLGMTDTWVLTQGNWVYHRKQEITASLLKPLGYDPTVNSNETYFPSRLSDATGGGPLAIATTAIDLLKWNLALHRDKSVLPAPLYELFIAPHSKGPNGHGYGYGIARDKTRFGLSLSHSAAGGARVIYIPSQELSFIVLNHVVYDWGRVEKVIQDRMKELEAIGENRQIAEKQAVKEILEKYPPEDRGYEAIVNIFEKYLNETIQGESVKIIQPIINVEQMMKKGAVEFKGKYTDYLGKQLDKEILNYLKKILENNDFQSDPFKFMKAWKERRGYTKEFRVPEDPVRMFLEKELNIIS